MISDEGRFAVNRLGFEIRYIGTGYCLDPYKVFAFNFAFSNLVAQGQL